MTTSGTEKELPKKNGGARPGAGRPKGTRNRRTEETAARVAATGITPLDFMLKQMRKPYPRKATAAQKKEHDFMRMQAARDAAPYVHSRLTAVKHSGGLNVTTHESALDELE